MIHPSLMSFHMTDLDFSDLPLSAELKLDAERAKPCGLKFVPEGGFALSVRRFSAGHAGRTASAVVRKSQG